MCVKGGRQCRSGIEHNIFGDNVACAFYDGTSVRGKRIKTCCMSVLCIERRAVNVEIEDERAL